MYVNICVIRTLLLFHTHTLTLSQSKCVLIASPSPAAQISSVNSGDSSEAKVDSIDIHVYLDLHPITNLILDTCNVEVRVGHRTDPT